MEQTAFELTSKQKSILATLSRATGKSIPGLLDDALEGLQKQERLHRTSQAAAAIPLSTPHEPSVLEIFQEARAGIPDEVWQTLPDDLAARHDHYIYGTPKRTP
jgi:hypothetical protein